MKLSLTWNANQFVLTVIVVEMVNQFACNQLEKLEEKYPVINKPADEVHVHIYSCSIGAKVSYSYSYHRHIGSEKWIFISYDFLREQVECLYIPVRVFVKGISNTQQVS